MKESKKRENSSTKKKKHGSKSINLDSWDQSDLEYEDEKVLERRLHHLKLQLQLAQEETQDSGHSSKHKKKRVSEEPSSDSDSSDSASTLSSASSSSNKYDNRKSSSISEDDRKKRLRSPLIKKKISKGSKNIKFTSRNERDNSISKEKKLLIRRKISPSLDKRSFRSRSKRSPSLDKREIYNRLDTSRWHDKAKEIGKERSKHRENDRDRSRVRSRAERNRSISPQRDRTNAKSKERIQKKVPTRPTSVASRRNSPDLARSRATLDPGRRSIMFMHKNSPRDERLGRHDERRLDVKVTRRNEVRAGDLRDVNHRISKDGRDRKEPLQKLSNKSKERELIPKHRETEHRIDTRDRNRISDDRFKERDKRLHDRIDPDRNSRNSRQDSREIDDKFRRNERPAEISRGNNRHPNESVFDRMRNRYNDRRNAENQRFGRVERDRVNDARKERIIDKEPLKPRSVDSNGAERIIRDRRVLPVQTRLRSPHRDRKEPFRNIDRRSPVNFERKFSSPSATRKVREDNRLHNKRRSLENDDVQWNKKKCISKTRSRSRSSERRKRRRSSQEEWRIIDMTSPVLDDELSDDGSKTIENNIQNKLKRPANNKIKNKLKNDESDEIDNKLNKTILTDELSDISDEDFNDVNANSTMKSRRDPLQRVDRLSKTEANSRKTDQKDEMDFDKSINQDNKNSVNDVDDIINNQKLNDDDVDQGDIEKNEHLDSEEETVSRVSDAIGVDWSDLVEDSKKKAPDIESSRLIRQKWSSVNIFSKIGISEKYAGRSLFEEIQKDLCSVDGCAQSQDKSNNDDVNEKIFHSVANLHVSLRDKAIKRKMLFEPYKTAISARKDIVIRRKLCGLPVKNVNTQHMIGICHWIV